MIEECIMEESIDWRENLMVVYTGKEKDTAGREDAG